MFHADYPGVKSAHNNIQTSPLLAPHAVNTQSYPRPQIKTAHSQGSGPTGPHLPRQVSQLPNSRRPHPPLFMLVFDHCFRKPCSHSMLCTKSVHLGLPPLHGTTFVMPSPFYSHAVRSARLTPGPSTTIWWWLRSPSWQCARSMRTCWLTHQPLCGGHVHVPGKCHIQGARKYGCVGHYTSQEGNMWKHLGEYVGTFSVTP